MLPRAPKGSAYAIIVSPRFFETFVLGPWETEQNRMLEKMYGTRVGPVLTALVFETWLAARFLPGGKIADAAMVATGFIKDEEMWRLWKAELLLGLIAIGVAAAAVAVFVALPEILAAVEAGAELAPELAELAEAGEATVLGEGEALATETAEIATQGPLADGAGLGEAAEIGRSAAPWGLGAPPTLPPPSIGAGSTLIGAAVVGVAAVEAQANPNPTPTPNPNPNPNPIPNKATGAVLAVEPVHLVPTELLVPARGKIEIGAKVRCGEDEFFIVGLATAGAP
jgi:hypothetical protein